MIFQLGEAGPDFQRRFLGQVLVQHQAAGMDFYGVQWKKPPHGTVKLDLKNHPLVVDRVLSLQAAQEFGH